jgi:glycosyltransferase involved in cell wall biosynthesis
MKEHQMVQTTNIRPALRKPLITIITAVFNGVGNIEETILSVINQTYNNLEHIIIDGGSTDGTVDIIKKYTKQIKYWVSELDEGIYDAYNKAIMVSSGEFVNFMDSGDIFYEDDVIEKIFLKTLSECKDADVIHGDSTIESLDGKISKIHNYRPLEELSRYMTVGMTSAFFRRSLLKKYKFNSNYQISGDYDFIVSCYLNGHRFYYDGIMTDRFRLGGISTSGKLRNIFEDYFVQRRIDQTWSLKIYLLKRIYWWAHSNIFNRLDNFFIGKAFHNILRKIKQVII